MNFTVQDDGLISIGPTALTVDGALHFAAELATAAYNAKWPGKDYKLHLVTQRGYDAMREAHSEVYVFGDLP